MDQANFVNMFKTNHSSTDVKNLRIAGDAQSSNGPCKNTCTKVGINSSKPCQIKQGYTLEKIDYENSLISW